MSISVVAEGEKQNLTPHTGFTTVTSKAYVDAGDATKQGVIPAGSYRADGSFVTYDTLGTPGAIGIATAPSYDATMAELDNGSELATIFAVTVASHVTCAGWSDGPTTADATHTDANC